MLAIEPTQLGIEFGSGAVIGALIGFAAKKVAKLIALLIGFQLVLFKFLESRGILIVNWDKLNGTAIDATSLSASQTPPSWLMTILSTVSVGAGFAGGFFVGFRKG